MKENKKIKNATRTSYCSIEFKSKLEESFYKTLLELGFNPKYEPETFVVWEGFNSITPFYNKETNSQRDKRCPKSNRLLIKKSSVVQPIKYTPDIYFEYNGIDVWLEVKGFENDVHYIKKKMFRKYLDKVFINTGKRSLYFEVYTKKQLLQAIDIIKTYG